MSGEFGGLVDFGIINASGGSDEALLALVVVKARNDKARLEKIKYVLSRSFKLSSYS